VDASATHLHKLNQLRFVTGTGKAFRAKQVKRLYLRVTAPTLALPAPEGYLPVVATSADEVEK
jgi:hypothetical protein